jgi:hypothetical protein
MDVALSYGLAGAGLALLVAAIAYQLRRGLNVAIANTTLVKLVRAGNVERLIKLCQSAPGTYFDAVAAAARAGQGADAPDDVGPAVHEAFEATARPLARRWRRAFEVGLIGALLVGAAVAVTLTADRVVLPKPLLAIAGLAVLAAIRVIVRGNDLDHALGAARTDVLPPLVTAVADTKRS